MKLFIDTEHESFYEKRIQHYEEREADAGVDIFCPNDITITAKSTVLIDLEVKCKMTDKDGYSISYYLYPRSSIYKTPLRMANSVGIIDSMYRHTIKAAVDNTSDKDYLVTKGTRLFQICAPDLTNLQVEFAKLDGTERGEGFGSSGK